MANETERFKSQALALRKQGLSYSQIEQRLTKLHGRKVVDRTTVWKWVKGISEAVAS